jgi:uncharacterized membrane protein
LSDRTLRIALAVVSSAGVAVAGYLTYVHYRPEALVCTVSGGCETVQESEYASLVGVPVALLGLIAYATVLVLTLVDGYRARLITAVIALSSVGFALYLIVLQAFVIDAWCVWCLVNDIVIVPLLAVLSVVRLRRGDAPS